MLSHLLSPSSRAPLATLFQDNVLDTWLATHGLCWPGNGAGNGGGPKEMEGLRPALRAAECADPWTIYLQVRISPEISTPLWFLLPPAPTFSDLLLPSLTFPHPLTRATPP